MSTYILADTISRFPDYKFNEIRGLRDLINFKVHFSSVRSNGEFFLRFKNNYIIIIGILTKSNFSFCKRI